MTPRNLVGISVSGGLGNQLFAYAVGRALALRVGGDLHLDIRSYKNARGRQFVLPAFGVEIKSWSPLWWRLEDQARRWSKGRWRPGPERLVEDHEFEPAFFEMKPPCFLRGYFQSWRYLVGVEEAIRDAFDTAKLSTPRIAAIEERIRAAACPVMVHVRRGDYVRNENTFPLLGLDHYEHARARLQTGSVEPTFFLFSDDIDAAGAMLAHWPNTVPVRGFDALEDFRLMSLCRHFLIANSTFSWWAAWLGRAPDKQVIAPSIWYGPSFWRPIDLDERLPPEWIRV